MGTEDYLELLQDLGAPAESRLAQPQPDSHPPEGELSPTSRNLHDQPLLTKVHPLDFTTSLSSTVDKLSDIELTPEQAEFEIDVRPFMNAVPLSVQEVCPVSRVFRVFRGLGLRHLVVVSVQ